MKALLIRHKKAGDGSVTRKALVRAIEEAGWTVAYLPRKKADAEAIAGAKPDLVAVAGGDGTVATIVKLLPDRSVPLAIIPAGTATTSPARSACAAILSSRSPAGISSAGGGSTWAMPGPVGKAELRGGYRLRRLRRSRCAR